MTLTHADLLSRLRYDQLTGVFVWVFAGATRPDLIGSIAGSLTADGYLKITLMGRHFQAHRLAYFYINAAWPSTIVDHRNGCRHDNRYENLRLADDQSNAENRRKARSGNTSGLLGVSWSNRARKWRAQIQVAGRKTMLGEFDDPKEAHDCYLRAKRAWHVGCTI